MITEKVTCDICGAQKEKANHWVCVDVSPPGPMFAPWGTGDQYRDYSTHLCGEKCAGVLLSRAIAEWAKGTEI